MQHQTWAGPYELSRAQSYCQIYIELQCSDHPWRIFSVIAGQAQQPGRWKFQPSINIDYNLLYPAITTIGKQKTTSKENLQDKETGQPVYSTDAIITAVAMISLNICSVRLSSINEACHKGRLKLFGVVIFYFPIPLHGPSCDGWLSFTQRIRTLCLDVCVCVFGREDGQVE